MTLVKSSMHLFLARIFGAFAGFLGTVYFSHVLGAKILGIYFLFYSVLSVLNLVGDLGLSVTTVKRLSEGRDMAQYLGASLMLRLAAFFVIVLIIILVRSQLDAYIGASVWLYVILLLLLMQLSDFLISVLRGENKISESAYVEFLKEIGRVGVQVVLVAAGMGLYGLIGGLGIGLLISTCFGVALSRTGFKWPKMSNFRNIFNFTKYSYGNSISGLIYEWFDLLVIGLLLSPYYVGVYAVCWSFSMVVMLISEAVALSIFPTLSNQLSKNEHVDAKRIISDSMAYSPIIAIPAFAGALILAEDVLVVLYGAEFGTGWAVLIVLMGVRFVHSLQIIAVRAIEAMNRPDVIFKISMLVMGLNLVGDIVLVYYFGIIGAAVATLISMSVFLGAALYYLKMLLDVQVPYRRIGNEVAAGIVMLVLIWGVDSILQSVLVHSALKLAVLILSGIVCYASCLFMFDRNMVADLREKILG